jgi:hypothetical protein
MMTEDTTKWQPSKLDPTNHDFLPKWQNECGHSLTSFNIFVVPIEKIKGSENRACKERREMMTEDVAKR